MTNSYNFSELGEIIRFALREQSIHPQGLNSSLTHGTLYPAGDPRNEASPTGKEPSLKDPISGSSRFIRTGAGSRSVKNHKFSVVFHLMTRIKTGQFHSSSHFNRQNLESFIYSALNSPISLQQARQSPKDKYMTVPTHRVLIEEFRRSRPKKNPAFEHKTTNNRSYRYPFWSKAQRHIHKR